MSTTLPQDTRGNPVQALAPSTVASVAIGAVSANVAIPSGADVVRIGVTNDCFATFGISTVTTDGLKMFLPKGSEIFKVPTGATHVAFIQSAVAGQASVTQLV